MEDTPVRFSKRFFQFLFCLMVLLVFAGCGNPPPVTTTNPTPIKPTAPFIQIATATLNGASKTILVTAPGLTLYYSTADTATTSACTGPCTATWHPLMFAGPGNPIAPQALPGKLSLLATAVGNQVEYNGHPLYTYMQDTSPGQAAGQGLLGKWFVATPDLPTNG